jgi:hypothetical protein
MVEGDNFRTPARGFNGGSTTRIRPGDLGIWGVMKKAMVMTECDATSLNCCHDSWRGHLSHWDRSFHRPIFD